MAAWIDFDEASLGLKLAMINAARPSVAIIGAGLSSLAAARELGPAFEIVVLEASQRIGGRLCPSGPFQMGAQWCHGTGV